MAESEDRLINLVNCCKRYFKVLNLKINNEKSAININKPEVDFRCITELDQYKYLGVYGNSKSQTTKKAKQEIENSILNKTTKILKTNINGHNLPKAINQFDISSINYYIGLLEYEAEDIKIINKKIRNLLYNNNIHYKLSAPERLYLKREDLGRGIHSINEKSERMLLTFYNSISGRKHTEERAKLIYNSWEKN